MKYFKTSLYLFKYIVAYLILFPYTCYPNTLKGFKDAAIYTVKIKTRIEYPFFEDSRSSRNGAGFLVNKQLGWVITNAHVSIRNPESLLISFKEKKVLMVICCMLIHF